jgi:hypothetical protein
MEQSDIADQSLRDQWRQLVFRPLSRLDGNSSPFSYVFIVDALDECNNEDHIRIILQLLAEARLLKVRLRVLITSRPEVSIRYGFCQIPNAEHRDFILHDIEAVIVDHDISISLNHELRLIGQERSLGAGWPGELAIRLLAQKSSALFIWASTACRFIRDGRSFAADRLSIIINRSSADESIIDDSSTDDDAENAPAVAPEKHLNTLYITALQNSARNYKKKERKKWYKLLRETIGTISLLCSPLSVASLASVLHMGIEDLVRTLNDLHLILDVPEELAQPIRLHHPSFRDFILDPKRCAD